MADQKDAYGHVCPDCGQWLAPGASHAGTCKSPAAIRSDDGRSGMTDEGWAYLVTEEAIPAGSRISVHMDWETGSLRWQIVMPVEEAD